MIKKKILIVLFFGVLIIAGYFFIKEMNKEDILEITERKSEGYQITEDFIMLDVNQKESNDEQSYLNKPVTELTLVSSAFAHEQEIPSKYTCDGENINPPLQILGVSEKGKSLVLIMEDPDAPDKVWNHWIKFNIPVDVIEIAENSEPEGVSGEGTGTNLEYSGPCPPENQHRYFFRLYELDTELTLSEGSSKEEVLKAMKGHILQEAELLGIYERMTQAEKEVDKIKDSEL